MTWLSGFFNRSGQELPRPEDIPLLAPGELSLVENDFEEIVVERSNDYALAFDRIPLARQTGSDSHKTDDKSSPTRVQDGAGSGTGQRFLLTLDKTKLLGQSAFVITCGGETVAVAPASRFPLGLAGLVGAVGGMAWAWGRRLPSGLVLWVPAWRV